MSAACDTPFELVRPARRERGARLRRLGERALALGLAATLLAPGVLAWIALLRDAS